MANLRNKKDELSGLGAANLMDDGKERMNIRQLCQQYIFNPREVGYLIRKYSKKDFTLDEFFAMCKNDRITLKK